MSIHNRLRRLLIKVNVLEEFTEDGVPYAVLERTSFLPQYRSQRALCLKEHGSQYTHSAIYCNPKYRHQPVYDLPQKVADLWAADHPMHQALVLGCAGCAFPRFLALSFADCRITGVEYSEHFVQLAERYFLLDQMGDRFTLLCDDAFRYLPANPEPKRNLLFVDIFSGDKVPDAAFSVAFAAALYEAAASESVIIVNLLNVPAVRVEGFLHTAAYPYAGKVLLTEGGRRYAVLTKTADRAAAEAFLKGLKTLGDVTVY